MRTQLCPLTGKPHDFCTDYGILRIPVSRCFLLACACGEIGYFDQAQQKEAA